MPSFADRTTDRILEVSYSLLDKGLIPDPVLRLAIRALSRQRLREIDHGSFEKNYAARMKWIEDVRNMPKIAILPEKANEQHYEVTTDFMLSCLGPCAKYSCCLYPTGKETLAEAEVLMMESYCEKASMKDGLDVLDLGCGWGSLSLYLAQKYPKSKITGLSNSRTQKEYIDRKAKERGLTNLEIITADVNTFDFNGSRAFDRIFSIEMFEHMKNYKALMSKVASWLRPTNGTEESLFFLHIFCHKSIPYHFELGDGWMARMFFSGGTMPSHDLMLYFQDDLTHIRSWFINGKHYGRTSEHWLEIQDANAKVGISELEKDAVAQGFDKSEGRIAFNRWRVFYLTVAEFFAMNDGQEWGVGHYLFKRKN
ncbi:S-adenosyl-L-methionine-dependent methyltransferase [Epithele typhae]|uniref:S-adenosyl-L-methionine-dependent methyltransferase n=1 Tax=Epithele typhae TaxID=378194 RepID=UPI0020084C90|nr:S-adenosyl-L-methionine-dependent methyltransferase [Epithele typhae]KAH9942400.1 S-adenosyl-L-methionine-dependent methyltransferase [Epithele typhae]